MRYEISNQNHWTIIALDDTGHCTTIGYCETEHHARLISDTINRSILLADIASDLYAALNNAVCHVRDRDRDKPRMLAALAKAKSLLRDLGDEEDD